MDTLFLDLNMPTRSAAAVSGTQVHHTGFESCMGFQVGQFSYRWKTGILF